MSRMLGRRSTVPTLAPARRQSPPYAAFGVIRLNDGEGPRGRSVKPGLPGPKFRLGDLAYVLRLEADVKPTEHPRLGN